jgi:hypothetical protein
MRSGTGILPVELGGIGILPMIQGLEAHATLKSGCHKRSEKLMTLATVSSTVHRPS